MAGVIAGEEWRQMEFAQDQGSLSEGSLEAVAKARQNIEKFRKRDVELLLVDRQGKPLPQRAVKIVQTQSDFKVGEQSWGLDADYRHGGANTDAIRYQQKRMAELFNAINCLSYWTERPENDASKTEDFLGEPRLENLAWQVEWVLAAGLTPKIHPLLWSLPKAWPKWLNRYDIETQMKFAEVRIRSIVARFKGRVKIYDAVNEPMWEAAPKNLPNRHWPHMEEIGAIADYCEQVLRWARDEDPDACFVINDYGMETDSGDASPKAKDGTLVTAALQRKRFIAMLNELKRRGSSPDALGLQQHTAGWVDHREQLAVYDEFAQTGLPVHITEFWATASHLEKAGTPTAEADLAASEYICNYLTCAYGHPAVGAFFFWGLKGIEWRGHSGHRLKPVYLAVQNLLKNEWMTKLDGTSDAQGRLRFRGFFGDYSLRYSQDGRTWQGAAFRVDPHASTPHTIALTV